MLNTMRILYVEDDEDVRTLMAQRLKRHVSELLIAADGKQGLTLYEAEKPDLVITDVQMPEMDGLTMASAIKAINRDTPIIVTTAYSDADYLLHAINAGIDGYVVKPIKVDVLLETLNKHARVLFNQREVARQNQELQRLYELDRQDHAIANAILQKMMQSDGLHDPSIRCHIQPAQEFSGDFVAAARAGNGELFVMLADATGHGLQAAVFLLPITRVFYSMVKRGRNISQIAAEMNLTMKEYAVTGRFIAAILVRLSQDSLEIWNGGMPTALFIDDDGNILQEFSSSQPPLGIVSPQDFNPDTESYRWRTSGSLFMTTDGLIEAENSQGEPFGLDRLKVSLCSTSSEQRMQNLIARIELHLAGKSAHDDMSCVLMFCS